MTSTGGDATTLGANDTVNGGAGTDTLNIEVLAGGENSAIQGNITNVEIVNIINGADLAATLDVTKLGTPTEVWQVTSAKAVSEVSSQTVGFKNVSAIASGVTYKDAQTTGAIALNNSAGSVTVTGAALASLSVSGTVKPVNAATAGTLTLVDGTGTDTVKTLSLALTNNATVNVDGLDALTTVNAAGSSGGITLQPTAAATPATTLRTITTGSGNDTVLITATTSATAAATVNTGAGKDSITVNTGTVGKTTVNAGDGDDTITYSRALTANDLVDGGAGTDTLSVTGTSLTAEEYEVLKAVVTNVEALKFSQAATVDASKLAQFSKFSFVADGSAITKVADSQSIATTADVTVTAAGYVAKGSGTPAATATTYAGTLTIEASGGSAAVADDPLTVPDETVAQNNVVVTAKADAIHLTAKAGAATASAAGTASFVELTGDVKTATVHLVNSVNAATTSTPTGDALANFVLNTASTVDGGGAYTALGGLTSLTLVGNGSAVITAGTGSKLATVDASGLTGVAAYDATKKVGGLTFNGADGTAETITLGTSKDSIITASTYDKMDTITGFTLVANSTLGLDATKSDDLTVTTDAGATITGFAKTTVTGSTLGLAVINAADSAAGDEVVFQYGGDTYVYVDQGEANVLDNADILVKLTGVVDLDLLVLALNA